MDELKLLAEARPVAPPDDAVVAAARDRLVALTMKESPGAAPRPEPIRGRQPRRSWRLAWGAGLAATAATAVAVGVLTAAPHDPAGTQAGQRPADAADLLHRASLVAATQELSPGPGQLVHVTTTETAVTNADPRSTAIPGTGNEPPADAGGGGSWLQGTDRQQWDSANGTREGRLRISYRQPIAVPGLALSPEAKKPRDAEWRTAPCTGSFLTPSFAFLNELPTEPAQLSALVDTEVRRTSTAKDLTDPVRRAETTWQVLSGLARTPVAPPKLRAAVYTLMAEQPDVRLVDDATDAAGRQGVAVSRTLPTYGVRMELIFAADSYRYLGERQVTIAANSRMGLPANVTVDEQALLSVEVVDAAPAPGPGAQIADCGSNSLPRK